MPRGVPKNPRFKKAAPGEVVQAPPVETFQEAARILDSEDVPEQTHVEDALPRGWAKGALLNVRNTGAEYRITLFPEEFDPEQPERCLRFTNPAEAQNFVSAWYQRTSNDPRAR